MLRVLIMVYIITHYCIASVTFCAVKRFHSERRNWQVLVTMEEYLPLDQSQLRSTKHQGHEFEDLEQSVHLQLQCM